MTGNAKTGGIILVFVIFVVIGAFALPLWLKAPPAGAERGNAVPESPRPGIPPVGAPGPQAPGEQGASYPLKTVISFINIGLVIPLFVIYVGLYRRIPSSFTLGLLAVIFALGMYAVTSNPMIISLLGGTTGEIGVFSIIPDLCTTVALVILVWISLE